MSSLPLDNLQQRAIEQRRQLHETTLELKAKVDATRKQFDVSHILRQSLAVAAVVVVGIGLLSGYAFASRITHR